MSSLCASAHLSRWISRFGVPEHITSNCVMPFTSQLWTSIMQLLSTTLHDTTAYNPTADGMVERAHLILKTALIARFTSLGWTAQLPWVLPGLRTSPKNCTDVSHAELVYGESLIAPAEFFPSSQQDVSLKQLQCSIKPFTLS